MLHYLESPIEFLKGVGPQRGEILKKELGIFSFSDLLQHYPFRYVDRSRFYTISEANEEIAYIQLKGTITRITSVGLKRTTRLVANFKDETGTIELVWFQGIKWMRELLKAGKTYIVFGRPTIFNGKINIVHPEIEEVALQPNANQAVSFGKLQGIYSSTEKCKVFALDSKGILKLQKNLIQGMPSSLNETLSKNILNTYQLISLREAQIQIHFPKDALTLEKAQLRLKFEELFFLQLRLLKSKQIRIEKIHGKLFSRIGEYFNNFYHHHLPFALTNAQKKVLKDIRQDVGSGKQMNRLLQGDVGSGKTVVALLAMLMALDNGCQACLMAPTEILASQHFETITDLMKDMPVKIEILTGSTKAAKRRLILEQLMNGELHFLIGTHALIETGVQFQNLGMVVIDEQHRFGVEQRAKLWMKNDELPHVLVMTATPIPRTLAMTLYGDLDVSVIDELPPGRKLVKTVHKYEANRLAVFGFLKEQIALGRQVYIVYPLIEESAKLDYNDLMAGFESISREFPLPKYKVSIVHGKMKSKDKDYEMQMFKEGKTNILVATTVIEVGVNVPNASVMLIESAERFGLSQLHQLRGRVGRGADQSFCILLTGSKLSNDTRLRMRTMCETNDGFVIAETDLKLRGPGDIVGTQQSGILNFKIADLAKDSAILEKARNTAVELLKQDPHLMMAENNMISEKLANSEKISGNFSRVS